MLLPSGEDSPSAGLHLRDYWHVLLRRRWLALSIFVLVLGAGLVRSRMAQPVYQATAQLLIDRAPSVLGFDGDFRAADAREDFYQTQYRLLQSRLLARRVVERLDLLNDREFSPARPAAVVAEAKRAAPGTSPVMEHAIDAFLGRLKVEPVKNSQLVAIRFQSVRPERAAQAANALAEAYIDQTREFRHRTSAEAGAWLDTETQEQARKVETTELELQKYVESEGLGNIEERRGLIEQKLKDLGGALNAAKTRRLDKEALYRQMQAVGDPEELSGVLASPLIQTLRAELALLERQQAQLAAKGYLDEYPEVVKVRQQIQGTQQKIAAEARRIVRAAENDYRAAAAQEASTAAALDAATREALELSRRSVKYDAMKRDLEASKRLTESVLVRQKQTDASQNVPASNIHVIDAAVVPRAPIRPRPRRDLALAALLGATLAVVVAFLRDYFDSSVSVPSDARRLGLPVLGVISEGGRRHGPPLLTGPRKEPFDEAYRVLRSALAPSETKGHGQLLLVTSTLPGEGKSLTSANLALTLASADERVLLIDADLRRPTLGGLLKTRSSPGLADVIAGKASLEAAVHRVPGTRLSLMPAGSAVDRSPSDLLARAAFRDMLTSVRAHFDRVVVDSAPAGVVADALTLAPMADGVLVVAHSGRVTTGALAQVLERLIQARANVLGLVLNRARPELLRYDYVSTVASALAVPRRLSVAPDAPEQDFTRRMH